MGVLTLSSAHRKLTELQSPLTAAAGQVRAHWGTLASQSPPVCSICRAPRITAVHINTHHSTRRREHHAHFPHCLRGVWGVLCIPVPARTIYSQCCLYCECDNQGHTRSCLGEGVRQKREGFQLGLLPLSPSKD